MTRKEISVPFREARSLVWKARYIALTPSLMANPIVVTLVVLPG